MARHQSGFFVRSDRVRVTPGTTVRVLSTSNRRQSVRAQLLALGHTDLVLSGIAALAIGTKLTLGITLPGRYIEFEVDGEVVWQRGADFGVELGFLSARQSYGISLARQILQQPGSTGALDKVAGR
jgi:hypothetical protein